ncbi:hypothetical protein BU26DRAFT_573582 [Trematosphaeria pertusa]|uniref:Uncharacterized protein n=1 Tax=Trematosphaeria pertusa TaxID=390896 RepID=A0A6A6IZE1_9PLEO|nr:uncharacterized protein BU26DRAFT_573582 [Trematosphaeria pertusa]KAF2255809.1 hypothetical protein BU26DRAFT_573582 [Trematosphaeria pertusa]
MSSRGSHESLLKQLIQHSHDTDSPTEGELRLPGILERVGSYSICTIILGTACILGSFGFISFLWSGNSTNEGWRQIMITGWATRCVTLTALAIRTSISAQAIVSTSMLAMLALQWHEVPIASSAPVSLLRFANAGPSSLALPLLWPFRRLGPFPIAGVLVLTVALTASLTNITSTALLSDLEIGMLPGNEESMSLYIGKNTSGPGYNFRHYENEWDLWMRRPERFPAFAEAMAEGPVNMTGIHDTGVVLRAFLPIMSQTIRSNLRNFSGPTSLTAMRTICGKPKLDMEIVRDGNMDMGYHLKGIAWLDGSIKESAFVSNDSVKLDCLVPKANTGGTGVPEWHLTFCSLYDADFNDRVPVFKSDFLFSETALANTIPFDNNRDANAVYLVINVTDPHVSLPDYSDSEWTVMKNKTANVTFVISACMSVYRDFQMNVRASRPRNITEPEIQWDISNHAFDTFNIRRQLGATRVAWPLHDRGIMNLDSYSPLEISQTVRDHPASLFLFANTAFASWHQSNYSLAICQFCPFIGDAFAERSQAAVVADILKDTGHPALAIQAYELMVYGISYYNHLVDFDLPDTAMTRSFVPALRPAAWRGYYAVSGLIMVHLGLMLAVITLYFYSGGRRGILGGAWNTVAQLQMEEQDWVWDVAKTRTDRGVRKLFEHRGLKRKFVGLVEDEGSYVIGANST